MTIRTDFDAASQLPYSLPHSAQTDARSLAGENLRLIFLIEAPAFIADFQCDCSRRTQPPHQGGGAAQIASGFN